MQLFLTQKKNKDNVIFTEYARNATKMGCDGRNFGNE